MELLGNGLKSSNLRNSANCSQYLLFSGVRVQIELVMRAVGESNHTDSYVLWSDVEILHKSPHKIQLPSEVCTSDRARRVQEENHVDKTSQLYCCS